MRKLKKNQSIILFVSLLFLSFLVEAEGLFSNEDVIWSSGPLYFKYTEQDETTYGSNDHPVELDPVEISTALSSLNILDEKFFSSEEVLRPVFTSSQLKLLGLNLSRGLKNAKPEQDIIFVMEKSYKHLLVLDESALVAGRAFFKDGKLNIIIGDYNLVRNKAFESVYDPSGKNRVPYTFNYGFRLSAASSFKENTIKVAGVENKVVKNELRQNWFVIDVKAAASAVNANKNNRNKPGESVNTEAFQQETERLARERRQLRLEMAKMRKEMQDGNNKEQLTIEERLAKLDELREKKLITEDEYQVKRKEILDDI